MPDRSFWKDRPVFVTGHTGFKGSWLSLWLSGLGARVTGYALDPPTTPSLFEQAGVAGDLRSLRADLRDFSRLKSALAECRPDVVFHLAAQSVVRRGYEEPIETYSSNVMGTVHLLEALRLLGRPCAVVIVTSDKCYENRDWVWGYRERDPLGGHDPYSSSKACTELVTAAFRDSYFRAADSGGASIAVASARAGNVIGGGDWTPDQLVPDVMRAFASGRSVRIRMPHATRPWQFVLEPLRGYLLLAERLSKSGPEFAQGWNFGPLDEDAQPVSRVVQNISTLWGDGARWETDQGTHPHEARMLKLDISKARSGLGWSPKMRLDQAIEWVVEWYKAYREAKDLRGITRGQIARYEGLQGKG